MKISFKGGVHPPENKHLCKGLKIKELPAPETAYFALQQSIGSPAEPVVKKGDSVKRGTCIARATGFISSNVHSSISGEVIDIKKHPHPLLGCARAVIVKSDGQDTPCGSFQESDFSAALFDKNKILKAVSDSGIVGLGGAAFPTHVKLNPPAEKPINTVIINGAECEPYLTSDHSLMLSSAEKIVKGAILITKAVNAKECVIAVEKNKPDAIDLIKKECEKYNNLKVIAFNVKYPQGAEKQLIFSVTAKEVPSGTLPMDVGVLVQNVGTANAVYEAVVMKKPLYERVVTLSGRGILNPCNWKVRIGTPFRNVINAVGLSGETVEKLIMGGPMMGLAQYTDEVPVIKGTSGILVLTKKEALPFKHLPCIRCGKCVEVCPMGLIPADLSKFVSGEKTDEAKEIGLLDCMECGSCNYICPSGTNLLQYIKLGKYELMRKKNA